jgi:hypothetical protein
MSPIFGPSSRLRLVGVGLLVATFAAGGIVGAALRQTVLADPTPPRAAERERGTDRQQQRPRRDPYAGLGVTPEQRAQIDTVVMKGRTQVDAFWKQYGPVLEAIRDTTRAGIDRILTAEQRAEMDRRRQERREQERQRQQQQQQQRQQQQQQQPKPQADDAEPSPSEDYEHWERKGRH